MNEGLVLGTRFRNTLTQLPTLTYVSGGTSSLKLPKTFLHRAMTLRFRGNAVVGVGAATAIAEGPLNVIKKLEIVGDGRKVYQAIDGASAYRLSNLMLGKAGELDPYATGVATNPFSFSFQLHHEAVGMRQPNDSFLDPRRHEEVELRITWGTDAEIITPGGGGTATVNGTLDVILEQTTDGAESIVVNRVLVPRVDTITATNAAYAFELPRIGVLAGIFFKAGQLTGSAFVPNDIVVNRISLRSDSSFYHADGLRWDTLQAKNVMEHHLDRPFGVLGATGYPAAYNADEYGTGIEGYCFLPLIEDGMLSSGLDTLSLNTLELILDVTGAAGNQLVSNMLFFEPRDAA
jgi:hypothetical protein